MTHQERNINRHNICNALFDYLCDNIKNEHIGAVYKLKTLRNLHIEYFIINHKGVKYTLIKERVIRAINRSNARPVGDIIYDVLVPKNTRTSEIEYLMDDLILKTKVLSQS